MDLAGRSPVLRYLKHGLRKTWTSAQGYCFRHEVKAADESESEGGWTTFKEEVGKKRIEKGSWGERCVKTEGCDCLEREDICTNP